MLNMKISVRQDCNMLVQGKIYTLCMICGHEEVREYPPFSGLQRLSLHAWLYYDVLSCMQG